MPERKQDADHSLVPDHAPVRAESCGGPGEPASAREEFDAHSRRAEELRGRIESRRAELEALLAEWGKACAPLYGRTRDALEEWAAAVSEAADLFTLGVRQAERVGRFILGVLDNSVEFAEPTEAGVALAREWAERAGTFRDAADEEEEEAEAAIEGQEEALLRETLEFRAVYPREADSEKRAKPEVGASPEEKANFAERARARERERRRREAREKGAAARRAEAEERSARERRSARSVYLSLAKALHPDVSPGAAPDPARDEALRKAIAANEAGDLRALLDLERDWLAGGSARLEELDEAMLALYSGALRDQCAALELALRELDRDGRYDPVAPILGGGAGRELKALRRAVKEQRAAIRDIETASSEFRRALDKRGFLELVKLYSKE